MCRVAGLSSSSVESTSPEHASLNVFMLAEQPLAELADVALGDRDATLVALRT